jgi:hypothetical protein
LSDEPSGVGKQAAPFDMVKMAVAVYDIPDWHTGKALGQFLLQPCREIYGDIHASQQKLLRHPASLPKPGAWEQTPSKSVEDESSLTGRPISVMSESAARVKVFFLFHICGRILF